jgi:hypothetical protein
MAATLLTLDTGLYMGLGYDVMTRSGPFHLSVSSLSVWPQGMWRYSRFDARRLLEDKA